MRLLFFIQQFHHPVLDNLFWYITMFGSDYFFMVVATMIFLCMQKGLGYRLGLAYLGSGLLNVSLKESLRVQRPIGLPGVRSIHLETAGGYSFPSGHSQCAATFFTSLMVYYKKRWFYTLGAVAILLIGLSRIYLGVHTPYDVAAGIVIGFGWVFVSNYVFSQVEKGKPWMFLFIVLPALAGMHFFHTPDYYKAVGASIGFAIGYLTENHFIHYTVPGDLSQKGVRFFCGLAVLAGIKAIFVLLLAKGLASNFIEYFLMSICLTVIIPLIFTAGKGKS